ncbi:50S ribosomal protein L3 [Gordonibacter massiliensis (ex Traore et al. 2017)]|uniref:Large ribosomal subunit protein uL3 n=1 Tax=Gordonibacter massiliensis (ex Traore et al. 2017) TaxID=1841863 RepID=A0A842JI24_9ACTN|nr:50S ribosomal protein L3 [Gordonibacter massiliensis (ex Traore et al. 2017)]MBC2889498.1 50S ribosomal protein L3 [Gordonibacter massiliensis (ex Traore et al. 2017)]MBX9034390.1 50S ribosomal protein L3 [Gordonibacter massiliensis (ex Traore et al. 2017)]
MINAIYGKKIGMTQIFGEDDRVIPVTVIQAEPNKVCQVKTKATDGYEAVQMGFGEVRKYKKSGEYRVNKPMKGHFEKQGTDPVRYLREVRVENASEYSVGDEQTVAAFAETKKVDVTGTSKGKGFAGVMKRYGFRGGPGGHGAHFHRAPGSVGQCATPSRVFKGLKLPGHMGVDTVTVKNLEVVRIDEDQNLILVKGAVPGGKNGIVRVRMA